MKTCCKCASRFPRGLFLGTCFIEKVPDAQITFLTFRIQKGCVETGELPKLECNNGPSELAFVLFQV